MSSHFYSPDIRSFVTKAVGKTLRRRVIMDRLSSVGFTVLSEEGGFKMVYEHDEFPEWVVKVFLHGVNPKKDCINVPKQIKPHYLTPVYTDLNLLIQRRANELGGSPEDAMNRILTLKGFTQRYCDFMDIREENVRFHDYRPVIIDFCA